VWEADISGCFDNISHAWVLEHIPMERRIVEQWLNAGYIEENTMYPTRKGTPQGGIISPMIANMVLDGLEEVVRRAVPRRSRVNFIRYADDFIVTAKSRRLLEHDIIPAVRQFLAERGLTLSEEKCQIVFIRDGFTFLGQTFRKHGKTLYITPSKEGVLALIQKVGALIRTYTSAPVEALIKKLNQTLRGWANYHRHVVSSDAFSRVDTYVYEQLWRMIRRKHPEKSKGWLIRRYWTASGRKWRFSVLRKTKKGLLKLYQVLRVGSIGIKRHIKIKAEANPYLAEYALYFAKRRRNKGACLMRELSARAM
jgi:RNA-directed DNA polymerase